MATFDQSQLEALRRLLCQREQSVRADIGSRADRRAEEPYADMAGIAPDEGDEASADLFVDIDHAVIGMRLAELREIAAALKRMDDGTYGSCSDCGQPIEYERLVARPAAIRCARCQAVHERSYGLQVKRSF